MADNGGTRWEQARYVLIDLPSAHEIEDRLATECEFIAALLANQGLSGDTRHIKAASRERFDRDTGLPCPRAEFIHLAGHGSDSGLEVLGETIPWKEVARRLKRLVPPLSRGKRYLTLSCCYSGAACKKLRPLLHGHFTGVYHFKDDDVGFASAMAMYGMFYMSKLANSAAGVRNRINGFFEDEVLIYHKVSK